MTNDRSYSCPVCGFTALDEAPYDERGCPTYNICPCCGIEFGYDDFTFTHENLRREWIAKGMPWSSKSRRAPEGWDPHAQLREASFMKALVLDPKFLLIFGAWFNVDVIDLRNFDEVRKTAHFCASDLAKSYPDIERLIVDLSNASAQWNSKIVMQFIDATDTDWLFDDKTEKALKEIVAEIIEDLKTKGWHSK